MQYTTIEQSKRLVELGLAPQTADLFWDVLGNTQECHIDNHHFIDEMAKDNDFDLQRTIYPAWSLDALLKVIPCPYQMTRGRDGAVQFILLTVLRHDTFDTELEAVYTMVVWLLENDLLDEQKLRNYGPSRAD